MSARLCVCAGANTMRCNKYVQKALRLPSTTAWCYNKLQICCGSGAHTKCKRQDNNNSARNLCFVCKCFKFRKYRFLFITFSVCFSIFRHLFGYALLLLIYGAALWQSLRQTMCQLYTSACHNKQRRFSRTITQRAFIMFLAFVRCSKA